MTKVNKIRTILSATFLISCGESNFTGGGADQEVAEPLAITWTWPCEDGGEIQTAPETLDHIVITGPGPHSIPNDRVHKSSVALAGESCGFSQHRRNIVFVVDVSGSMGSGAPEYANDEYDSSTQSCKRFEAVSAVMNSVKKQSPSSRFAFITFSQPFSADPAAIGSSAFFESQSRLFDDFATVGGKTVAELICKADGGTDFYEPLQLSENLIQSLDANSEVSEVYFISDGTPSNPVDLHRDLVAQMKKDYGTNVATVMIGGVDDSELKDHLASVDENGEPYHAQIDDVADLSDALSSLSENQLDQSLLYYGSGEDKTSVDFSDQIDEYSFELEGFIIDTKKYPTGMDIEFHDIDRFGNAVKRSGTLNWE